MTEHKVYNCGWSKDKGGFAVWVKSRPKLRGEGATYEEAEGRLLDAILNAGGATHAVLELDPPLPSKSVVARFCAPELFLICGDGQFRSAEFTPANASGKVLEEMYRRADEYYEQPVCRSCRCANSPRTSKPLQIASVESGCDGAFGGVESQLLTHHYLFAAEFLSILTANEKKQLEFRSVEQSGRGRRQWFELVGPTGVPLVALRTRTANGWFCEDCGNQVYGFQTYGDDPFPIDSFVCSDDLPNPLPSLFTVGTPPNVQLCVTRNRWQRMLSKKGTRGLTSEPLGVLPSSHIIRSPKLKSLQSRGKRKRR